MYTKVSNCKSACSQQLLCFNPTTVLVILLLGLWLLLGCDNSQDCFAECKVASLMLVDLRRQNLMFKRFTFVQWALHEIINTSHRLVVEKPKTIINIIFPCLKLLRIQNYHSKEEREGVIPFINI